MNSLQKLLLLILPMLLIAPSAHAGGDPGDRTLGLRLGWSGGPNGLSYRKVFNYNQAFELVFGYNGKEARTSDNPFYKKGNTFLGITYAPFVSLCGYGSRTAFVIHANLGTRLRYHNYRPFRFEGANSVITPDVFAGGGVQLDFGGAELFADLNVKYYSQSTNGYIMGMESGLGMRFAL